MKNTLPIDFNDIYNELGIKYRIQIIQEDVFHIIQIIVKWEDQVYKGQKKINTKDYSMMSHLNPKWFENEVTRMLIQTVDGLIPISKMFTEISYENIKIEQ